MSRICKMNVTLYVCMLLLVLMLCISACLHRNKIERFSLEDDVLECEKKLANLQKEQADKDAARKKEQDAKHNKNSQEDQENDAEWREKIRQAETEMKTQLNLQKETDE